MRKERTNQPGEEVLSWACRLIKGDLSTVALIAPEILASIWRGIILIQRKGRLVGLLHGLAPGKVGSHMTYTEGLVLHVVESLPERNVKELAGVLKLERSWVSRIITELEKRKIVKAIESPADKRSKQICLTASGSKISRELNEFRRSVMEEVASVLNPAEQIRLGALLRLMADGLAVPQYASRAETHPIEAEIVRISWGIGVVGENFLQSKMNVTQYQMLFAIVDKAKRREAVFGSDLFSFMPFDMSTISRTLVRFVKEGLLERSRAEHDKRNFPVRPTAKGWAKFRELERAAKSLLQHALAAWSSQDLEDLAALLGRITAQLPTRARGVMKHRLEARDAALESQYEYAELQKIIAQSESAAHAIGQHQGRIPKGAGVRLLCEGREIKGLVHMQHAGAGRIKSMLIHVNDVGGKELLRCLQTVLKSRISD